MRRELNDSKICSMLFKDFQQEQLFQKSKSYFKNLMNYSLTKSFSFIKTWDSLSSEFAGEAVHFPSLYLLLQKRILHDPEFQFYLLYVNNLLKYEKGRKEMGLTNSVIFKILFIMLKKEEMRFEDKSIFKNQIKRKIETTPKQIKKVKTELTTQAPSTVPKQLPKVIIPTSEMPTPSPILAPTNTSYLTQVQANPYLRPPLMQNKHFMPRNPSVHPFIPPSGFHMNQSMPHNLQRNLLRDLDTQLPMQPMNSHMPLFPMQNPLINTNFTGAQMAGVFPFPNMIKKFPINKTGFSGVFRGNLNANKQTKKPIIPQKSVKPETITLLKKRTSSVSKKERKSSLSDTNSISSSSISYSLDSREDSRKKSISLT